VYEVGHRLAGLWDKGRLKWLRHHLDRGMRLPRLLRGIPVRTVYLYAERDYRPEEPFDGELVLFRATAGRGAAADEPCGGRYDDPMLGWGRRATRGVRVIEIPGGHSSMLQEPHVGVLAEHLQASIDRALGGEPAAA